MLNRCSAGGVRRPLDLAATDRALSRVQPLAPPQTGQGRHTLTGPTDVATALVDAGPSTSPRATTRSVVRGAVEDGVAESEILGGDWIDPWLSEVTLGDFGRRWIKERTLKPRTRDDYELDL